MPSFLALIFRTTDDARWGPGKNAILTKEEFDDNNWTIDQAIKSLTENPTQPMEIGSITVEGNQMTITLSDGVTKFGPYTLPVAAFNVTGPFQGNHDYARFDLLQADDGMYLVLQPHTSLATFDPNDGNINGPYYYLMFPYPTRYDVGLFFPGQPGFGIAVGQAMFAHLFRSNAFIEAGTIDSVAALETAPAVDLSFPILKNSDVIGSIDFAAGSTEGTFTFPDLVQFFINDRIRVLRPAILDVAARDLMATIVGQLGGTVPSP
jgi:hypothetical protein